MARIAGLILISLCSQLSFSQTEIKTMFYNLLNFSSAPPENRLVILNSILSTYEPDLFMVCEVESQQDAKDILTDSFRYTTADIVQSPFLFNTSGASLIHQLVYYDSNKFTLKYTEQIKTKVRSINHYSFELKTNSNIKFEVFVAHFKASRGTENEVERSFEAQQFINYIQNFPEGTNILLAGDFNMYSASETAFQTLLNGTSDIAMVDPINEIGDWNNNSSFAGIHTQSTRESNSDFSNFGAGGGLDDRFDMLLISEILTSEANSISYIKDTYKAWGNNSNCFNNSINDLDCDGEFDQELRNLLYQMSDHLPVVMEFSIKEDFLSVSDFSSEASVSISNRHGIYNYVDIKFSPNLLSKKAWIYNTLGQEILKFDVSSPHMSLDLSTIPNGLYLLKVEHIPNATKFHTSH